MGNAMGIEQRVSKDIDKERILGLWNDLGGVPYELWRRHQWGENDFRCRLREATELLCSVAWHLELASNLGPFPDNPMSLHREIAFIEHDMLHWGLWLKYRSSTKVTADNSSLLIAYNFNDLVAGIDFEGLYAIKSTLVADAAMRLYGAADSLRRAINPNEKYVSTIPRNSTIKGWCSESGEMIGGLGALQKSYVLLVAFRDSYMHTEVSDYKKKKGNIHLFRERFLGSYTLGQMLNACTLVAESLTRDLLNRLSSVKSWGS